MSSFPLKLFRPDHGDQEVHAERQGDDSNDEVLHKIGSYNFAQNWTYKPAMAKKPTSTKI
jgi:hypothetical protein